MPGFKPLKPSAAASTKPGRQPLLLQGCCSFLAVSVPALQPALCLHSLLLLRHSSLPFARLQTPKTLRVSFHQAWPSAFAAPGLLLKPSAAASTKPGCQPLLLQGCCSFLAVSVPALQPALCLHSLLLLGHSSLPFARLQTPKTLRGSFHQAWPSAFAAPGLLLFPGRQRSSIAACPLPAQPSLVRAFEPAVARLQMPKTLRGSFHQAWPSAFAAPGLLLFPGRQRSSIAACPLPAQLSLVRAFEPAVCQASNP